MTAAKTDTAGKGMPVGRRMSPFDTLVGQPGVVRFFKAAQEEDRLSHAFLFVGPVGSGKTEAAYALARALLCEQGGCDLRDACDTCARISRGKHPDVHVFDPEGVNGYLAEQVRELIHEVALAPVRATGKVYLITRGDLLRGAPANAFLKTIEEPPEAVTFIILARTRDSVMDTILSRCQVVVFRHIPDSEAISLIQAQSGAGEQSARIALAVSGGSVTAALSFLASPTRQMLRHEVIDKLEHLPEADDLTVLDAAKALVTAFRSPLDEVKLAQEAELEEGKEYLSKGALSILEKRHKRELSQQERRSLEEVFQVARSWLRDCLAYAAGARAIIVNTDCLHNIEQTALLGTTVSLAQALQAIERAEQRISYNVSPQLVIETMLFDIKEAFHANDCGS